MRTWKKSWTSQKKHRKVFQLSSFCHRNKFSLFSQPHRSVWPSTWTAAIFYFSSALKSAVVNIKPSGVCMERQQVRDALENVWLKQLQGGWHCRRCFAGFSAFFMTSSVCIFYTNCSSLRRQTNKIPLAVRFSLSNTVAHRRTRGNDDVIKSA